MNEPHAHTEPSDVPSTPSEKRPWVTPAATVEQVSDITNGNFNGLTNDGATTCSS
jgi:hypothetical protein